MAYLVNTTSRAERDLEHLYNEINATGSDAARKWYKGLRKQILSLEEHPNRCPVTPENKDCQTPALRSQASRLSCDLPRSGEAESG
ncbi:MAG: type II toxin-antitoxin system RelE/ParE family toxin [Candidatus Sulfotelmatobacter sp.]|jgi:plasmid stabilization system protein ParE